MKIIYQLVFLILPLHLVSQIVTIDPTFPTREELITVTYDASQGSGGLIGESQVYMHTGLITNQSTSSSDWKNVVSEWGTDDSKVKMTNKGNNLHELNFVINDFYGVPSNVMIEKLAFVFRNVDGSKEGKTATGGDIFVDYLGDPNEFTAFFESPAEEVIFADIGESIAIKVAASLPSSQIELFVNNNLTSETISGSELTYNFNVTAAGEYIVRFKAVNVGELIEDEFTIIASEAPQEVELPVDAIEGITWINGNTIRCVLYAPGKSKGYVIGSFNDWQASSENFMNVTPDGGYLWQEITGLDQTQNHALRYLIDGSTSIADPHSELVVHSQDDWGIAEAKFPNLPHFELPSPGYATWLRPKVDYTFQHGSPDIAKEDLVIYEVLLRDFVLTRSYYEMIEKLDHIAGLGVNAIEFMPVSEFEGNDSWGYNPSYHNALDKYYGTPENFKELVDACHQRGIAVILDVVYNHAFSQSPLAQLWWDPANFRPAADNPYLNLEALHPFNVGYDFNHESEATKRFVKRSLGYWMTEYNIDGFRFDLSKGFSQRNVINNADLMASYDESRINILKDYADHIWSINPESKIILEHFADNTEEKELSEYGLMLWSSHVYNFNEATMGYNNNSNFEWIDYKRRGWQQPLAVGYMESHDEERLMYKNLTFGNEDGAYSPKIKNTALMRNEAATAMFYLFPGPKMLWQFGELGYDYSINRCTDGSIDNNCRLAPKPVRWDYLNNLRRQRLYDVTAAMIKLKTEHNVANDVTYSHQLEGAVKTYQLETADYSGTVVANYGVTSTTTNLTFDHTGDYFDYLTGDTITVTNTNQSFILEAGEYHVYLDTVLAEPVLISGIEDPLQIVNDYVLYPNPVKGHLTLSINMDQPQQAEILLISNDGKVCSTLRNRLLEGANEVKIDVTGLVNGLYHVKVKNQKFSLIDQIMIVR